jgi:hypothetical protein
MARYEDSPADRADDKRMAKKRGMSLKEWESSAEDAKRDAAAQSKLDGNGAKETTGIEKGSFQTSGVNDDVEQSEPKAHGGIPNHHFAHSRPVTY